MGWVPVWVPPSRVLLKAALGKQMLRFRFLISPTNRAKTRAVNNRGLLLGPRVGGVRGLTGMSTQLFSIL